ncbi:3-oxoacyl-[acyl-carrier-protein] synthase III C-terminal domain-containing protein [Lentzea sp. DG1S-22]|uniref:3-oxoacyl-ACP synthase III family protein n=1 Tax=Lentzea sp. DG1S-22 TaxID=3108822 RepID=UPI002E777DC3|nr:3-oxoacyl-[acyl-carrier-protein] synthase III C-terminal domain-containing protein [Lentzea sp. DG1S-22]WVH84207.1 3-oxoacyl-[acyl-carrier-protein] synthase III C-terminal domain-containing protein [Lentzea sp. DG1S-22]
MTVHFGVVSLGHVLGDPVDVASAAAGYTADVDRVLGWGYRTFHRAGDGVGLTDLAAEAGAKALGDAGVQPHEVDLVVLAMSDLSEHLYWDAAGATQAKIGAHRSENVLLTQACGGGVAAFDIVAGKFATHPGYSTALIIGANRVCEPYWNRMEINTSIFSDGAAAAVVKRDHPRNRWLTTEIISDGRYADFMMMDVGAAARPFAGQQDIGVKSPQKRLEEFFAGDIRKMFEFVSTIRTNNHEVVRRACDRVGTTPADLRKLLHLHDSVPAMTLLAKDLDHGPEWTNTEVAQALGHVGCADQLMSLEHYLAAGELTEGDVVALTSTASGMHWLCTLLAI